MPMVQSTKEKKPSKPYPDFPLFPHATKRWAKKIRGKHHYFGPWSDPDAALQKYLDQKDDLHAGRTPRNTGDGLTVAGLCNHFLTAKSGMLKNGELVEITFQNYYRSCSRVLDVFEKTRLVDDLRADDFGELRAALAKTLGPTALKVEIQYIRTIFKFAFDQRLIQQPVSYGQSFQKPSQKVLRQARQQSQQNGRRMFEAAELRHILDALDGKIECEVLKKHKLTGEYKPLSLNPAMKAMVLLGINCGFGQSDIANLPQSAIDFDTGWVDYPRSKTATERRILLWPETIDAVQDAIYARPKPKDVKDEDLVFLTGHGLRWVMISESEKRTWKDSVARCFGDILRQLNLKRPGLNFYALRHTFETIGGESKDQVAVNAIMGHVDNSMAGVYRERISDERLKAVTDTVREWLWGT
jgi:integrase